MGVRQAELSKAIDLSARQLMHHPGPIQSLRVQPLKASTTRYPELVQSYALPSLSDTPMLALNPSSHMAAKALPKWRVHRRCNVGSAARVVPPSLLVHAIQCLGSILEMGQASTEEDRLSGNMRCWLHLRWSPVLAKGPP